MMNLRNILPSKKNFVEINDKLRMVVPEDMIWAFTDGMYYEKNVDYWINEIIGKIDEPVFYDIGANLGYYSLKYSSACSHIYSFEPVDSTFLVLINNVKKNKIKNVDTYQVAIGNKNGHMTINIYSSSGNNSLFRRNMPKDHPTQFVRKEKIQIKKLDSFVKENNLTPPNLIKIDVEGGEFDALKGASKTIREYNPVLLLEYSAETSIDAGYQRTELLDYIKKLDYKVYGLSSDVNSNKLINVNVRTRTVDNLLCLPPNSGGILS